MKQMMDGILALHLARGYEMVASGRWQLAGENRALDVVSAVQYLQRHLSDYPYNGSFDDLLDEIDAIRQKFHSAHYDEDGFGSGTFTDIAIAVEAEKEKAPKSLTQMIRRFCLKLVRR